MIDKILKKFVSNEDKKEKYFEHYKIKEKDLRTLYEGIDLVSKSQLVEKEVLENIRVVTYDSEYLYIFTRGEHSSNDKYHIDEVESFSKAGFRIFRIKHSGFIGKTLK
jgi:hypothetical protein